MKINMLLSRLPRLRDRAVAPERAFAGTFHVNEGYAQLARAYQQAAAGTIPERRSVRGLLPFADRPVDPRRRRSATAARRR